MAGIATVSNQWLVNTGYHHVSWHSVPQHQCVPPSRGMVTVVRRGTGWFERVCAENGNHANQLPHLPLFLCNAVFDQTNPCDLFFVPKGLLVLRVTFPYLPIPSLPLHPHSLLSSLASGSSSEVRSAA